MPRKPTCKKCGSELPLEITNRLKPGKIDNEDMLVRLFYANLTHDEIADYFGVTRVAVTNRVAKLELKRKDLTPQEYEAALGDELLNKIQLIMGQITADKINKASLNQLGTLLGILYDKRSQHERRGAPDVSYVGVVHKLDPNDRQMIEDVMKNQTKKLLDKSKKEQMGEQQEIG